MEIEFGVQVQLLRQRLPPQFALDHEGQDIARAIAVLLDGRHQHMPKPRFESLDGSFVADIVFDDDGIVLDYPGIAGRL